MGVQKTKKQHIVPQCYLVRFSKDGHKIFAFDKTSQKSFATNVRDIAQQHGFYDIPEEFSGDDGKQRVEHFLANLESVYSQTLRELLNALTKGDDWSKFKERLAFFIALQVARTPEVRYRIDELFSLGEEGIKRQAKKDGYTDELPDLSHLNEYQPESAGVLHGILLTDPNLVYTISQDLLNHIWIVGKNDTGMPLFTSDNPVIRAAHKPVPLIGSGGLAAEGIEIQIPLTPEYVLILYDRKHFRDNAGNDGRVITMDVADVAYCNTLQVSDCYRFVYSSDDAFKLARDVCNSHPEVCSPNHYGLNFGDEEDASVAESVFVEVQEQFQDSE